MCFSLRVTIFLLYTPYFEQTPQQHCATVIRGIQESKNLQEKPIGDAGSGESRHDWYILVSLGNPIYNGMDDCDKCSLGED